MKRWSLVFLLIFHFSLINVHADDPCTFYCFSTPKNNSQFEKTLNGLKNLHCTHLVYGPARIDQAGRVSNPTDEDILLDSAYGNFGLLREVRKLSSPVKTLLAVREGRNVHILDTPEVRDRAIKNIIEMVDNNSFDGIFFDFRIFRFASFHFRNFVDKLKEELTRRGEDENALILALAIDASAVFSHFGDIKEYEDDFDVFYLKSDNVVGAKANSETIMINPLYQDHNVQREDALSVVAEELVSTNIPRSKIIIGLTSWARGYEIDEPQRASASNDALGYVKRKNSLKGRGRFAYQEICNLTNSDNLHYEKAASAVWFMGTDGNWYSHMQPGHVAVDRTLNWISTREYGGVGITQLESDDPDNECREGQFPLHKYVSQKFSCTPRQQLRGNSAQCKRICISRSGLSQSSTDFSTFKANWCSHYVISSIGFSTTGFLLPEATVIEHIAKFNSWTVKVKPYLLLSVGDNVDVKTWKFVMKSDAIRRSMVNNINNFVKDNKPDGIVISWLNGGMSDGSLEKAGFSKFLKELRNSLSENSMILVTVTPESSYGSGYDVDVLNKTANYLLMDSYRFHSADNVFNGHPSPLLYNSELVKDPQNTAESFAINWDSLGYPHDRLIPMFSPQVLYQGLADSAAFRSDLPFGLKTDASKVVRNRAMSSVMTQTELCVVLNNSDTKQQFITELGVPIAMKGDEFYAFEDKRSIQVKTIWTSLNRYGGIALQGIEMDNPAGQCPAGEPYPLLRTIVKTQTCDLCFKQQEISRKREECAGDPFRAVCSYRLPDANDPSPLLPQDIPFDQCSEVVVEEVLFTPDMSFVYRDPKTNENMEILKNMPKKGKRMISAVRCDMNPHEFATILDPKNRDNLVAAIWNHVIAHGFDGIELRCADVLLPDVHVSFSNLQRALLNKFRRNRTKSQSECPKTLSVRIPVWQTNLTETYDVEILNHLHQVVLEPFQIDSNTTQLISPLFGVHTKDFNQDSIDNTLKAWYASGLERSRILLHIPSYGIVQTFAQVANNSMGARVTDEVGVLNQRQLCQMLRAEGSTQHMKFDMVAAYATTADGKWISFETQQTIAYKIKYAMKEQLAGVGLLTINEDDFQDSCKRGAFPMLKQIRESIC